MKHLIALLFFVGIQLSYAANYTFNHYQVDQGLSNNAILCSMQDSYGFMWFGTKDGLNRYDGYEFKIFRSNPNGLASNFIRALYEDEDHHIWIGTDQGLFIYDPILDHMNPFYKAENGEVLMIQGDDQGNIWFIADNSLYRYAKKKQRLDKLKDSYSHKVSAFFVENSNSIWFSTNDGKLNKLHSEGYSSYSIPKQRTENPTANVEMLFLDSHRQLFLGTSNHGVLQYNPTTDSFRSIIATDPAGLPLFVRDIIQTAAQEYWFATESGLIIYNAENEQLKNLKKEKDNPLGLSDNAIYSLFQDKNNAVWVGTYFGGINYYAYQNSVFETFFPRSSENSIAGYAIREIVQDQTGNMWIGTEDAGLSMWDLSKKKFINFHPSAAQHRITHSNIHGLLVSGDTLLIGTFDKGLDILQISSQKLIKHLNKSTPGSGLHNNFIYHIYKTRKGEILLATGRGVYSFDLKNLVFKLVEGPPDYIFYTSIFEDEKGDLWFGTWRDGLVHYQQDTGEAKRYFHHPENPSSLPSNRVTRVFQDSNKELWVATEAGLSKMDQKNNHFEHFTIENGLPSNLVLNLLEDNQQNLWITTSKGLVQYNLNTKIAKTYNQHNGLLGLQFNYNSGFKDKNGYFYFGSTKGLIRFLPENIHQEKKSKPASIYITALTLQNQEQPRPSMPNATLDTALIFSRKIELPHDQSTFSLRVTALNYNDAKATQFLYKLVGYEKEWISLKDSRTVYFTKLPPGTYQFQVKLADHMHGAPASQELLIVIHPPLWRTVYAYAFYFLAALLFFTFSLRSYENYIKDKSKQRLASLRSMKDKELQEAKIDFFTNVAHDIKTPLTLIKAPLEKVLKKIHADDQILHWLHIIEANTNKLVVLTNQLLDFRKVEASGFSLMFQQHNLSTLLLEVIHDFASLATLNKLQVILNIQADIMAKADEEAVKKIFSNLINNALKYAATEVSIKAAADLEQQLFIVEIKNDGPLINGKEAEQIFSPFNRLARTSHLPGTGLGLALAKSLVELHNGTLKLVANTEEKNLFVLILPLTNTNPATL